MSNEYGPHLLPHHAEMLKASAISPEVAEATGSRIVIDVPLPLRKRLGDPTTALIVTEGSNAG